MKRKSMMTGMVGETDAHYTDRKSSDHIGTHYIYKTFSLDPFTGEHKPFKKHVVGVACPRGFETLRDLFWVISANANGEVESCVYQGCGDEHRDPMTRKVTPHVHPFGATAEQLKEAK